MTAIAFGNHAIQLDGTLGNRVLETASASAATFRWIWPASVAPPPVLLGRDVESDAIRQTLRRVGVLSFHGPCGYGVSSLLLAAGSALAAPDTPCVHLRVGSDSLDDILSRLVAAHYVATSATRPTRVQSLRLLHALRSGVLLDDVRCSPEVARAVVDALPNCAVFLGSTIPLPTSGRGTAWAVTGLPYDAAVQLIISAVGRPLPPAERAAAEALTRHLRGVPLPLLQAAAQVRQDRTTFAALMASGHTRPEDIERLSIDGLPPAAERALSLLALVAGSVLPGDVVTAVTGLAAIPGMIEELRDRHLVEVQDGALGVPLCRRRQRLSLADYADAGSAARELATWLLRRPPTGVPFGVADAAITLLGIAAEQGDHEGVVLLTRCLEPLLLLAERWDACGHILDVGIQSAQQIGDRAQRAYLSHQRGSLAIAQGDVVTAQNELVNAMNLRRLLQDPAGAARSEENLALVSWPPGTRQRDPRQTVRRRAMQVGGLAAAMLTVLLAGHSALAGQRSAAPSSHPPTITHSPSPTPTKATKHPTPTQAGTTSGHTPTKSTVGKTSGGGSPTSGTTSPTVPSQLQPKQSRLELTADVTPGSAAGSATDSLTNPNATPVTVTGLQLAGGAFTLADPQACVGVLAPHQSCTFTVQFRPSALGATTATLSVQTSEAKTTTIRLDGTGYLTLTVTTKIFAGTVPDGAVTADAGGLSCPGSCSVPITSTGAITLTVDSSLVKVAKGPRFDHWDAPCAGSGEPTCSLGQLTADTTVTANFVYMNIVG
jgi:hypothetical protein